jgi:hypothetical protein
MLQRTFIKRTINYKKEWVRLSVEPIQTWHLKFWHDHIQPSIKLLGPTKRVDHDWNWYKITFAARYAPTTKQKLAAYALVCRDPKFGTEIVCGLIHLARNYHYLPDIGRRNPIRRACFLWNCATAPTIALQKYFPVDEMPKRLSQLCVDIAVTVSENDGHDGRICLHADPGSMPPQMPEDILLNFYQSPPLAMSQLDPSIVILGWRRIVSKNDGRYFYFDDVSGFDFSLEFTGYRHDP